MPTATIPAGDSYSELVTLAAYPATSGWVLKQRLTPQASGGTVINLTATAEGDSHRLAATPATTAAWAAGGYAWVQWVENATDSHTTASGQVTITPDLRQIAAGTDTRSQARRALDDCRAAFAAWTPAVRRYKVADTEREFNSVAEILRAISYWQAEVNREAALADPSNTAPTTGGRFYIRAR